MDNVDSDQTVWMDALADMSLQWMGISEDMFFQVAALMFLRHGTQK